MVFTRFFGLFLINVSENVKRIQHAHEVPFHHFNFGTDATIFIKMSPQWPSGNTLELVDGSCQVQSWVALVDLAVQSFPCFFPKLV